jgi:hypothetical protein
MPETQTGPTVLSKPDYDSIIQIQLRLKERGKDGKLHSTRSTAFSATGLTLEELTERIMRAIKE